MNKEEIETDNKLVAKFMGYSFSQEYQNFNDFDFTWEEESDGIWYKGVNEDQDTGYVKINGIVPKDYEYYLKYHESWNKLMPVVQKIEDLGHPTYISANNCILYGKPGRDHGWIIDKYGKNKIEAVWLAVISFIKWHNDNIQ